MCVYVCVRVCICMYIYVYKPDPEPEARTRRPEPRSRLLFVPILLLVPAILSLGPIHLAVLHCVSDPIRLKLAPVSHRLSPVY